MVLPTGMVMEMLLYIWHDFLYYQYNGFQWFSSKYTDTYYGYNVTVNTIYTFIAIPRDQITVTTASTYLTIWVGPSSYYITNHIGNANTDIFALLLNS